MSTPTVEYVPAPGTVPEQIENLATATEKLAAIRFLIIITARWESSDTVEPERRKQFQDDLKRLRRQYTDKIDEIAMHYGVQMAMNAQHEVERSVKVPAGARPPMRTPQPEKAWF